MHKFSRKAGETANEQRVGRDLMHTHEKKNVCHIAFSYSFLLFAVIRITSYNFIYSKEIQYSFWTNIFTATYKCSLFICFQYVLHLSGLHLSYTDLRLMLCTVHTRFHLLTFIHSLHSRYQRSYTSKAAAIAAATYGNEQIKRRMFATLYLIKKKGKKVMG